VGVLTAAFAAGGVLLWPRLGTELVPPLAQGELTLALELPEGTPLARTAATVGDIEARLRELPGVALVAGEIGIARDGQASLVRRKENRAELQVRLTGTGAAAEARVLESIRGVIASHEDVGMRVQRQSLLNFGSPVEVNVYGWNLADLQATADRVAESLRATPGLRDVRRSLVPGSPEVQVSFDRDKLNRHGLSLGAVSETVRGKLRGTVATRFRDRERHVDIRVLNSADQRTTLTAVEDLIVAEQDGVPVRLGSIAELGTATGPAEIHRLGGKRVAIVGLAAGTAAHQLTAVYGDIPIDGYELDPEIETRIAQYEMAYRMQTSVPELTDISQESKETLELYGPDVNTPGTYAYNCLLARRLAERNVRFTQVFLRGWDHHGNLPKSIPDLCKAMDQPTAALLKDLKQRGMLQDTLVVWGGEFGRTVYSQGTLTKDNYGRDHHPRNFCMWLAGAGIKPGIVHGETDDFSYNVVDKPVHIHDLNATILHCLGIDHERLTYRFQGRDFRLTDIEGNVVKEILA